MMVNIGEIDGLFKKKYEGRRFVDAMPTLSARKERKTK